MIHLRYINGAIAHNAPFTHESFNINNTSPYKSSKLTTLRRNMININLLF